VSISYLILYLLFIHFVADFIAQSDWMAINKSKRWDALSLHVAVYTVILSISIWLILPWKIALIYGALNGAIHFITDAITSRITSTLWARNKRHWFFVAIGADQFLHYFALIMTYEMLIK